MSTKIGLSERIDNLSPSTLWWILIIIVFGAWLAPLKSPILISDESRAVYDIVESLPQGSMVLFSINFDTGNYPEAGPEAEVLFKHLVRKGHKIVMLGIWPRDVPSVSQRILNEVTSVLNEYDYEYGVDYVNLGYIPGLEIAYAQLADDFKIMGADIHGTPISQLSIMDNIVNAESFDLVIDVITLNICAYVKYWTIPYGTRLIIATSVHGSTSELPFIGPGMAEAMMYGLRHTAEYEIMTGFVGMAGKSMNVISAQFLLLLLMILIGNIAFFFKKMGGED